ncbi:hypothetical protein SLA2020_256610 [Shorea laevis]
MNEIRSINSFWDFRQRLLNALSGKVGKRMGMLWIPLVILHFKHGMFYKEAYIQWLKGSSLNMSVEGIINHSARGFGGSFSKE